MDLLDLGAETEPLSYWIDDDGITHPCINPPPTGMRHGRGFHANDDYLHYTTTKYDCLLVSFLHSDRVMIVYSYLHLQRDIRKLVASQELRDDIDFRRQPESDLRGIRRMVLYLLYHLMVD
jgi:hypothetical protein